MVHLQTGQRPRCDEFGPESSQRRDGDSVKIKNDAIFSIKLVQQQLRLLQLLLLLLPVLRVVLLIERFCYYHHYRFFCCNECRFCELNQTSTCQQSLEKQSAPSGWVKARLLSYQAGNAFTKGGGAQVDCCLHVG